MEQMKRGLCLYDDKWYLLADLPDGRPNLNTHAYFYCCLAAEKHLVNYQPEPNADLIILHPEERFARRHARVKRRLEKAGAIKMEEELPMLTLTASYIATSYSWVNDLSPRVLVGLFE